MANTEGMPDEFVESLATAGSIVSSFSPAQSRERQRQRQIKLQERMDLPLGGSPAAKVIRASPRSINKDVSEPVLVDEQPSETMNVANVPLIGDIIEHNNQNSTTRRTSRVSRFASQQRLSKTSTQGFPSVHGVPLGTFVKSKKKIARNNTPRGVTKAAIEPIVSLDKQRIDNTNPHDLMKQASQNESESMLADMSLEEIKDHQKEIEQALSPGLLAFLKNRRKQQTPAPNQQHTIRETTINIGNENVINSDSNTTEVASKARSATNEVSLKAAITTNKTAKSTDIFSAKSEEDGVERKEKERIAKLISAVRTHEDLDATYRSEMNGDVFDIEFQKNHESHIHGCKNKEEFFIACDLLRSSSPRQTLWAARTVSLILEGLVSTNKQLFLIEPSDEGKKELQIESKDQMVTVEELPSILPVSLRCLLDKPLNSSCNYLLHTYALQSLYFLIVIYAHPGHDVINGNSSGQACSIISIFQEDFMDDAVPSPLLENAYPPMSVQPLSVGESAGSNIESNATNSVAAYMTSSSSPSAVADGDGFKKDPMWTLLSKMKIIPRLAFILERQQHIEDIPAEAFTAICGIISMIGQRSPGAASAIVQHKTLISLILRRMLQQIQQGNSGTDKQKQKDINSDGDGIIFSTIQLFCILSRQSRVVAENLPLEDILPPLLAAGLASSYQQFRAQQHALFLWRTMLRYGLGLEALASMLTISAQHLALPYSHRFSLSSDFLSSFTLVLECTKVVWHQDHDRVPSESVRKNETQKTLINQVTETIAGSATRMMTSNLQTILHKIQTPPLNKDDSFANKSLALRYRWNASSLLYLSAWFELCDPSINPKSSESIIDLISLDHQETLLLTLQAWAEPNGDIDMAWQLVPKWCDSSCDFEEDLLENGTMLKIEASACAFVNAYFSISLVLLRSKAPNSHLDNIKRSLQKKLIGMVSRGLKLASEKLAKRNMSNSYFAKSSRSLTSVRERWINQCQFAVIKFCFHSTSMGLMRGYSEISLLRGLVFSLIGRLQKGDESIAAVLFSSDILFQTSGNPVQNEDNILTVPSASSPISSMFLVEFCGSEDARKQLDHSFKLHHGFGITSAGYGPFQLDSLLSSAEIPGSVPTATTEDNQCNESLPLGRLWLWKCLSGSLSIRDEVISSGAEEAADVIAAVLELILDLNETEGLMDTIGYSGQLPVGSKLYYLMNVCLHNEEILRDERVLNSGEMLLDRYLKSFGFSNHDVIDFCQECLVHLGHSSNKRIKHDDEDDEKLNAMDQKLLDQFADAMTIDMKDSKISSEQIRAVVAFLEDLTAAYRDYGAQYDFFTKCIRVFMLPMFPSLVRCRLMRELDSMLHLLTVTKETSDESKMFELVSKSLTGGLPSVDNSVRDDNDILNAVTKAITAASPRPMEGYMRHYCIGMLVRNFSISLSTQQGVEISKKRLKRLNAKTVQSVCKATDHFLQSNEGTKSALVKAIIYSSSCDYNNDMYGEQSVVKHLDSCIERNSS